MHRRCRLIVDSGEFGMYRVTRALRNRRRFHFVTMFKTDALAEVSRDSLTQVSVSDPKLIITQNQLRLTRRIFMQIGPSALHTTRIIDDGSSLESVGEHSEQMAEVAVRNILW